MPWRQRLWRIVLNSIQLALLIALVFSVFLALSTASWTSVALLSSLAVVLVGITFWPDLKNL
jgi:hypothetical protein